MDPQAWGSCLWRTIHILAIGYPDKPSYENTIAYKNFFENLWKVLPCHSCSVNYKRHLKEVPLDDYLVSNSKLFEWTVTLHNLVNAELNKPLMSLDDATKLYRSILKGNLEKKEIEDGKKWFVWFFLILIIGIIIYLILSNENVKNYFQKSIYKK
jgi:hypothetical protein